MAAASSSYSALLRRSKLATYHPSIDQVYTTSSAHLARQNFGLKRPLPAATTKTSPFVRLTDLDSKEGRTVFRKATRETSFVKKVGELGVGLRSEALEPRADSRAYDSRWDRVAIQSRFIPEGLAGGVKDPASVSKAAVRTPNFLAMDERDFERFLEDLGDRRDEFKAFVAAEANKTSPGTAGEEFDLYSHAQRNATELVSLVERFLRRPSPQSAHFASSSLLQIHPTLALQYATPTPLESAFAPPVPGRLLGPSPDSNSGFRTSSGLSGLRNQGNTQLYSSVLSTVSPISAQNAGGLPTTTFYPDASSYRSNLPGRAAFRLSQPSINPVPYASHTALSPKLRASAEFRPATAEYEPRLLALRTIQLNPIVETPSSSAASAALRHPLGSPSYSGALPPDVSSSSRHGRNGKPGAKSMSDYFGPGPGSPSYRSLGVNPSGPRDLVARRRNSRSKEEHDAYLRQRDGLVDERQNDGRIFGGAARGKRAGSQRPGQRNQANDKQQLIARLQGLLNREE
ncbi:hypothetical protein JCM1841_006644 [Sporobolomyces salmonicolor]